MDEIPIKQFKALPQRRDEVWQGGLVRMPAWITEEGPEPYQPLIAIWVAVRADLVHAPDVLRPDEADPAAAVEAMIEFALHSGYGGYRPGRVEVADAELAERLGFLGEVGVEVRVVDRLEAVERVLDAIMDFGAGEEPSVPGPLDAQGVTVQRMRHFAEAAAAFYRAAPWQYLADVDLVEIEKPKALAGMRYVVVLGAGRSVYGLGFYRSVDDYDRFRLAADRGDRGLPDVWQVSFDTAVELPPRDVDLWEEHDLPLASGRAHPMAMWFGGRGEVKRPTGRQLAFFEGVLWALAETREADIDSGRWKKEVQTHDGPVAFTLAIPDLLESPSFQKWIERGFEPDRRAHERMFADMDRYFRKHPPANPDEMEEAAARLFSGRKIDELVTQPETPLERAQELCYEAFGTHGRRRVQLARQALEICPDCADAYVILAEQAGTLEAELDNYAKGVAAGERGLGPETFEEHVGHFWGVSSTRPYMRARFGLAQCLDQLRRTEEAIDHYQEMLRLNPNDNQGVRYVLMPKLLQRGRDVEAARLLKGSEEQSANWAYARALLAFRLSERPTSARRELRVAFRANPHVPECLLEEGPLPMPPHYSPGSPEEAVICAEEMRPAFAQTEGALEWMAREHRQWQKEIQARRKAKRRKQRGQKRKGKGR